MGLRGALTIKRENNQKVMDSTQKESEEAQANTATEGRRVTATTGIEGKKGREQLEMDDEVERERDQAGLFCSVRLGCVSRQVCVTEYISTCVDNIVLIIQIKTFPYQKPSLNRYATCCVLAP